MLNDQPQNFSDAAWIGAPPDVNSQTGATHCAPQFRQQFSLAAAPRRALWHICGLGYHEPWCNGGRVGDHVLDPAQTDYEQRCFYVTHDMMSHLHEGDNVIGIVLGNGWYNQDRVWGKNGLSYGQPRLVAVLEIELADGSTQRIVTSADWRCAPGAITSNNIYAGETYDARLETPGWSTSTFDDAGWMTPITLDPPGGQLQPQAIPPMRRIERLRPRSIQRIGNAYIVDMGQNFSGWAEIRMQGNVARRGNVIRLRFAEAVDDAGNIDTASTGVFATKVEQVDEYICKGDEVEVWEPRFTYHGYRYVEVTGWPTEQRGLTADDITGVVVHTDLKPVGQFECSDERLNQLHTMALWTHRSNVHGIPEDCPARERCGWLGDANVVAEMSLWNYESADFWMKYLDDIETTRRRFDGLPAAIAPGKRTGGAPANPDWAAAFILLPWYVYLHTADVALLAKHYDGAKQLMEHFGNKAKDWILEGGYGDWFDPGGDKIVTSTPPTLTTTLWFHRCAEVMSRVADLTGHPSDVERYAEWMTQIRAAVINRYYNAEQASFGSHQGRLASQTAGAMALQLNIAPDADRQRIADAIAADIESRDNHFNVGIMGIRFLFEALTRHGHGDIALATLRQDTYPSFGDQIARGATTLWEWWGEEELAEGCGPRSLSHPMFAGYDNWFYNTLAGLRIDEENPGFRHIYIEPHPITGIDWVKARHETRLGLLEFNWQAQDDQCHWVTTIPAGMTATFQPPTNEPPSTLEPGTHNGAFAT